MSIVGKYGETESGLVASALGGLEVWEAVTQGHMFSVWRDEMPWQVAQLCKSTKHCWTVCTHTQISALKAQSKCYLFYKTFLYLLAWDD